MGGREVEENKTVVVYILVVIFTHLQHTLVHSCVWYMYEHTRKTMGGFPTSARAVLNFLLLPPLKSNTECY